MLLCVVVRCVVYWLACVVCCGGVLCNVCSSSCVECCSLCVVCCPLSADVGSLCVMCSWLLFVMILDICCLGCVVC